MALCTDEPFYSTTPQTSRHVGYVARTKAMPQTGGHVGYSGMQPTIYLIVPTLNSRRSLILHIAGRIMSLALKRCRGRRRAVPFKHTSEFREHVHSLRYTETHDDHLSLLVHEFGRRKLSKLCRSLCARANAKAHAAASQGAT